jgi:hypothetical protein
MHAHAFTGASSLHLLGLLPIIFTTNDDRVQFDCDSIIFPAPTECWHIRATFDWRQRASCRSNQCIINHSSEMAMDEHAKKASLMEINQDNRRNWDSS